jgi:hypothetical protein
MRRIKYLTASAEEIQHAIDTMDTPSYCNWCEQFYDGTSRDCHHCNSDDTESYRDMPYYLDIAVERETKTHLERAV